MQAHRISPYRHVIESQQFDLDYLQKVFKLTDAIKKNPGNFESELAGKSVALIFYETSTRTRMSFEAAALKMGARTVHTENARDFSSVSKGESLEDTIKVISHYCDFLILRHNEDNSSKRAVKFSKVPLINGGSGSEQHPTQALLDVYTIFSSFKRLDRLNVMIVGDLLRGRTCSSLIYLLSKYQGNRFFFVSPPNCRLGEPLRRHLVEHGQDFVEIEKMEPAMKHIDVVYMTRIQKERFESPLEYEQTKGSYILDAQHAEALPEKSIILHPLPRIDEIHPEVDANPRAKYFEQVANGVHVRMALLKILNDANRENP